MRLFTSCMKIWLESGEKKGGDDKRFNNSFTIINEDKHVERNVIMRNMRKVICIIMMLIVISTTALADMQNDVRSTPLPGEVTYTWREASRIETTSNRGSTYKVFYTGEVAERDGETDTCSITASGNVEATGVFNISKSKVLSEIGVTLGASISVEASKTSAPLKKGEFVVASWRMNWKQWKINQERVKLTAVYTFDGDGNPTGIRLDEEVVDTAVGYVYKPIMPQIRLQYYSNSTKNLVRTEYYTFSGNEYVLENRYESK